MQNEQENSVAPKVVCDFLGNQIIVGCFVATSGGGNKDAEYGSLLYHVTEVNGDSVVATRLKVLYNHYPQTKTMVEFCQGFQQAKKMTKLAESGVVSLDQSTLVYPLSSKLTNLNKYVVVNPPSQVVLTFKAYTSGNTANARSWAAPERIGEWLHGMARSHFAPENFPYEPQHITVPY